MAESADRRQELLLGICAYLLANGLAGLSLRPLAAFLGTSARMLIYHFGSKENMVREALGVLRERHQGELAGLGWNRRDLTIEQMLVRVWDWMNSSQNRPAVRLSLEIGLQTATGSPELRDAVRENEEAWVVWMESMWRSHGWPKSKLKPLAVLTGSVMHGLMMRAASSGDVAGGRRALRVFAKMLRQEMGEAW